MHSFLLLIMWIAVILGTLSWAIAFFMWKQLKMLDAWDQSMDVEQHLWLCVGTGAALWVVAPVFAKLASMY